MSVDAVGAIGTIRPAEANAERKETFRPKVIEIGKFEQPDGIYKMEVVGVEDVDGETVTYYPRIIGGEYPDMVRDKFGAEGVDRVEMTGDQLKRLDYCLTDLNLPVLVAVHLVFNEPEVNLDEFFEPGKEGQRIGGERPVLVGVYGESGAGKSTALAVLAYGGENVEVANFDYFSKYSLENYLEQLRNDQQLEVSEKTIADICASIGQLRETGESQDKPEKKNLREVLSILAQKYKQGKRPAIMLCDLPGGVKEGERKREEDVFDWVIFEWLQNMELVKLNDKDMAKTIKDYLVVWQDECGMAALRAFVGDENFRELVREKNSGSTPAVV